MLLFALFALIVNVSFHIDPSEKAG